MPRGQTEEKMKGINSGHCRKTDPRPLWEFQGGGKEAKTANYEGKRTRQIRTNTARVGRIMSSNFKNTTNDAGEGQRIFQTTKNYSIIVAGGEGGKNRKWTNPTTPDTPAEFSVSVPPRLESESRRGGWA